MTNIKSDVIVDNRNLDKTKATVDEILNDDTPLDEQGNPIEKEETEDPPQQTKPPENQEEEPSEEEPSEEDPENKEDETEDGEIDEETGELKKKAPAKEEKQTKQTTPTEAERLEAQRRENVIINARNEQLTEALSKAREVKPPTEEELQNAAKDQGFDWEEMTTFERAMFKDNVINKQKLQAVDEAVDGVKNIDAWSKKVNDFLETNERDQTDKALIGKEAAFREYAMKASHRGVSLDILVGAFLHSVKDKLPTRTRDSLFLTKGGGTKVERKNNLTDAEYSQSLRKTNNRDWMKNAKRGKINIEI